MQANSQTFYHTSHIYNITRKVIAKKQVHYITDNNRSISHRNMLQITESNIFKSLVPFESILFYAIGETVRFLPPKVHRETLKIQNEIRVWSRLAIFLLETQILSLLDKQVSQGRGISLFRASASNGYDKDNQKKRYSLSYCKEALIFRRLVIKGPIV